MPAIDWISVRGFRSLENLQKLELRAVNVVIGANGSGKSNFIEVFSFLNAIREGRLKEYVGRSGGAEALLFLGSKRTKHIEIHVAFSGEVNQYKIDLIPTDDGDLIPFDEIIYYWDKSKYQHPYDRSLANSGFEAAISKPQSQAISQYVRGHLGKWRVYHFHDTSRTSPLKQTAEINDNRSLRADAANLAPFLYMLRNKHSEEYNMIVNTIKSVAPYFMDFSLEPSALNEDKIRLEWRHESSDAYFAASSMSDGTLRFVALATLLLQPAALKPSVIIIDEPELGLHPYALTILASMIRRASIESQIIISTQSALLLDNFDPEDVLVANRQDNATVFCRLTDDSLDAWLEDYSLGQLWEKGELGGRPTSEMERD
ncbi:AAA family ATPase [Novosphingobium sp. MW5]|nr:AAA family ATPase [Novosphingobium sp. MW5]